MGDQVDLIDSINLDAECALGSLDLMGEVVGERNGSFPNYLAPILWKFRETVKRMEENANMLFKSIGATPGG
jgi:hypothetical protein